MILENAAESGACLELNRLKPSLFAPKLYTVYTNYSAGL
jgi:hypothetical protein